MLKRDWPQPYTPSEAVEAAWLEVYRDPQRYWELYQLAEKLVDIDDATRPGGTSMCSRSSA